MFFAKIGNENISIYKIEKWMGINYTANNQIIKSKNAHAVMIEIIYQQLSLN